MYHQEIALNSLHKKHPFYIIKPNFRYQSTQSKSMNIFQENKQHLKDDKQSVKNTYIVGGMQAFLKEQRKRQCKQKNNKSGKHNLFISQKKVIPKSGVLQSQSAHTGQTRQQKQKQKTNYFHDISVIKQEQKKQHYHQQDFKTHQQFRPKTAVSTVKSHYINGKNINKDFYSCSSGVIRPSTSKVPQKTVDWASSQIQDYNNKSAMLSQITYTQPLHKRYGDRYFQFCLRDRYKQDLPLPPFIYQIRNKIKVDKFTKTIQKFRPDIGVKDKIILKGRHTINQINQ